jgi:hypothetical protein
MINLPVELTSALGRLIALLLIALMTIASSHFSGTVAKRDLVSAH